MIIILVVILIVINVLKHRKHKYQVMFVMNDLLYIWIKPIKPKYLEYIL